MQKSGEVLPNIFFDANRKEDRVFWKTPFYTESIFPVFSDFEGSSPVIDLGFRILKLQLDPLGRLCSDFDESPESQKAKDPVGRAALIAAAAHRFQVDKLGIPYLEHPRRVFLNARHASEELNLSHDEQLAISQAAWLHDVLEDSERYFYRPIDSSDLLRWGMSSLAVQIVELLSRSHQDPELYYGQILAHPLARIVKLADILDNRAEFRLKLLPEATQVRLTAKYQLALEQLEFSHATEAQLFIEYTADGVLDDFPKYALSESFSAEPKELAIVTAEVSADETQSWFVYCYACDREVTHGSEPTLEIVAALHNLEHQQESDEEIFVSVRDRAFFGQARILLSRIFSDINLELLGSGTGYVSPIPNTEELNNHDVAVVNCLLGKLSHILEGPVASGFATFVASALDDMPKNEAYFGTASAIFRPDIKSEEINWYAYRILSCWQGLQSEITLRAQEDHRFAQSLLSDSVEVLEDLDSMLEEFSYEELVGMALLAWGQMHKRAGGLFKLILSRLESFSLLADSDFDDEENDGGNFPAEPATRGFYSVDLPANWEDKNLSEKAESIRPLWEQMVRDLKEDESK